MSNNQNPINQNAYLRTSREYPTEINALSQQVDKSYIDIANAVNERIIGLFPTSRPSQTGERWFLTTGDRRQTLRQVYSVSSATSFSHNISGLNPTQISRAWGTYTDGTNAYGIVFGTSVAVAGILSFYVTSTQIVFVPGAGAPTLTSGRIILEWLSNS